MQLGFTCNSQLSLLLFQTVRFLKFTPSLGLNFSQYLNLTFLLVFFFLDYSLQIPRFLDFLGSHITKTFFDVRPIERATQKVDFSGHECMRSGYNI